MTQQYSMKISIPYHRANDESYIQHALSDARRKMAIDFFQKINYGRYFTIKIDEIWPEKWAIERAKDQYLYDHELTYRLTAEITEVRHRQQYMIHSSVPFDTMSLKEVSLTAVGELKKRFAAKMKQLASKPDWRDI